MSEPTPDPEVAGRVRVTSPLTTAPLHVRRTVAQEIDEDTGVGEAYMRSLIRSQLRAALGVVVALVVTVGSLPIAFLLVDDLGTTELLGVPLPWLVLGVLVYPLLYGIGWLYVRRAERTEADFTHLVDPRDGTP